MKRNPLSPVHPGEILREEFLGPLAMSRYALAAVLRVPRTSVERLVREEFWLGIQARYDVEMARQSLDDDIAAIKPRKTA
jgi:plasmid maintenance system antidote protein VapI